MPHVIIEHSANVADHVDIDKLVRSMHERVLATGLAPLAGLRTRALSAQHYVVADGLDTNGYVAVTARLGPGRSDDDKQRLLNEMMAVLDEHLEAIEEHLALSVELQDIDPSSRINQNHLRARIGGNS
jgi:5-carboxymethyl-2-hydroxymuconate isomerase